MGKLQRISMPIKNLDLFEILREQGLTIPNLKILVPDVNPADVAVFQPTAEISATDKYISAAESSVFRNKANSFIDYLIEQQPNLAVTPEYCMPWSSIERILENGDTPNTGCLWLLGCESCSPEYLDNLIGSHPNVAWHSDHQHLNHSMGEFVDPIVLCFMVHEADEPKLAVCLQYKCAKMGGDYENRIESDNLIIGRQRYFLRSDQDSITLFRGYK